MKFANIILAASLLVGTAFASTEGSASDFEARALSPVADEILGSRAITEDIDVFERDVEDYLFERDDLDDLEMREPILPALGIRVGLKAAKGLYHVVKNRRRKRDLEDAFTEEIFRRVMDEDLSPELALRALEVMDVDELVARFEEDLD
ncbi:hypothetical protein CC1G_08582 [Coprinopsis cinerea okayama7|uniref:Uncharacterized protein n=1 Tax=Coprinopsis cinerea (strain Okayama-7 / 130 / ATCC MYA-4618 / FGSC 9003) TaxID=240176 RepID=A8NCU8_COPC7|nr:hypothetical protein CC1G_08582 [Coprinopsis cinerea okayama7\|eukprot:XP_001832632.1 hypothetical protein CC1G_08582 [Coprinopsis cinerea okayama7\